MMRKQNRAWEKFPIEAGEVWIVGPHHFLCGDLEAGDFEKLHCPPADLVYCDPPWGPGIAKIFRTKAGVPNPNLDYPQFLASLGDIFRRYVRGEVWLDMGCRWIDLLDKIMAQSGARTLGIYETFYGRPSRPARLWRGAFVNSNFPLVEGKGPTGLSGEKIAEWIFNFCAQPGGIVIDPCIGLGMTARFAHRYGMICYGMELHPRRLAVTIEWLAKQGLSIERRQK